MRKETLHKTRLDTGRAPALSATASGTLQAQRPEHSSKSSRLVAAATATEEQPTLLGLPAAASHHTGNPSQNHSETQPGEDTSHTLKTMEGHTLTANSREPQ